MENPVTVEEPKGDLLGRLRGLARWDAAQNDCPVEWSAASQAADILTEIFATVAHQHPSNPDWHVSRGMRHRFRDAMDKLNSAITPTNGH